MDSDYRSAEPSVHKNYSNNQVYAINVVPADLRHEEMILRASEALEKLEKVSLNIFGRISNKIAEKNAELENICKRIDIAQVKINKVKGSKKATVVFSSPKYPILVGPESFLKDFTPPGNGPLFKNEFHNPPEMPYDIKERFAHYDSERLLEKKKQFFSIPLLSNGADNAKQDSKKGFYNGLGNPPNDLTSVTSLLLFNTSDNPYSKMATTDPLLSQKSKKGLDLDDDHSDLQDAPNSISRGLELYRKGQVETFSYNPSLGDVPMLSVPDFLPDLAGIADDLHYTADLGPSIAPSLTEGLRQLNLPPVQSWSSATTLPLPTLPKDITTPAPPLPPTLPSIAAPPPPPPLPVILPPPPPSVILPPPPPPPLVIQPASKQTNPQPDVKVQPKQPTIPASDSRASLMEAIRGAGGARKANLRNAKEIRMESKKNKAMGSSNEPSSDNTSGDLMSDLAAKLQLRRKGLMGMHKEKPRDAMNVLMERVPVIPQKKVEVDDDDDDWK